MIELGAVAAVSARAAATELGNYNATGCTSTQGQLLIDQGDYEEAILVFTCLIEAQPTDVEGYRGRIEAEVLLGRYSDAVRDYQRVIAFVLPVHPDAQDTIMAGYEARMAVSPDDFPALTGASFAHWWFFHYASAIHVINHLLAAGHLVRECQYRYAGGNTRLTQYVIYLRALRTFASLREPRFSERTLRVRAKT
jgi:hypothetical protein